MTTDTPSSPTPLRDLPPRHEKRPRKSRAPHATLRLIATALIVLWVAFWVRSFVDFQFATFRTWVPAWHYLSLDYMHCHLGVRAWADGLDPYRAYIGDFRGKYAAPPITLALFAWTRWCNPYVGAIIWDLIITAAVCYTVVQCVKVRRALGLWVPPMQVALAAMLWSMPILFAIERGNLDVWVLITLFMAMNLMRRGEGRWHYEVLAGLVLAVGAWAKMYSGLFVITLLPFRKWTACLACVVGIVLIAVVPLDATRLFFKNAEGMTNEDRVAPIRSVIAWAKSPTFQAYQGPKVEAIAFAHSLTSYWPLLLGKTPLGSVPGLIGTAVTFGVLWLFVAWRVHRSPTRQTLFLPFTLWTMALGTYALPLSYDYNLFFLLFAALCLWDLRDRVVIHVMMLTVLLWWQPIGLPIHSMVYIWCKFFAIIPVSVLLVIRAGPRPTMTAAAEAPPVVGVPAIA